MNLPIYKMWWNKLFRYIQPTVTVRVKVEDKMQKPIPMIPNNRLVCHVHACYWNRVGACAHTVPHIELNDDDTFECHSKQVNENED